MEDLKTIWNRVVNQPNCEHIHTDRTHFKAISDKEEISEEICVKCGKTINILKRNVDVRENLKQLGILSED
jgi:hypothetical protein